MNSTGLTSMATATYIASAVYFGIVGVIAMFVNVCTITVYIKNKKVNQFLSINIEFSGFFFDHKNVL